MKNVFKLLIHIHVVLTFCKVSFSNMGACGLDKFTNMAIDSDYDIIGCPCFDQSQCGKCGQYFQIKILLEYWIRLGLRLDGEGGLGSFWTLKNPLQYIEQQQQCLLRLKRNVS